MRFYTNQHPCYCGIDLHARPMYVCILSQDGEVVLHRNMPASPDALLKAIAPYRDNMVIAGPAQHFLEGFDQVMTDILTVGRTTPEVDGNAQRSG